MNSDTIKQFVGLVNPHGGDTDVQNMEHFAYTSFGLPFALLILITAFKYFLGTDFHWKNFWDAVLELSIDTLTILVTIIFTYTYPVVSLEKMLVMMFLTILVILISSIIRRRVLNHNISSIKGLVAAYFTCWLLTIGCMIIIYNLVL